MLLIRIIENCFFNKYLVYAVVKMTRWSRGKFLTRNRKIAGSS